jgi:hypothetical protein
MPDVVLLDAGPLGMASHPRPSAEILAWMSRLFAAGVELHPTFRRSRWGFQVSFRSRVGRFAQATSAAAGSL